MMYKSGIYHSIDEKTWISKGIPKPEWTKVDHSVLLVGWGEDQQTHEKFWVIQNTWGPQWGEDGFFRMRRGFDEFGIESICEAADPVIVEQASGKVLERKDLEILNSGFNANSKSGGNGNSNNNNGNSGADFVNVNGYDNYREGFGDRNLARSANSNGGSFSNNNNNFSNLNLIGNNNSSNNGNNNNNGNGNGSLPSSFLNDLNAVGNNGFNLNVQFGNLGSGSGKNNNSGNTSNNYGKAQQQDSYYDENKSIFDIFK